MGAVEFFLGCRCPASGLTIRVSTRSFKLGETLAVSLDSLSLILLCHYLIDVY